MNKEGIVAATVLELIMVGLLAVNVIFMHEISVRFDRLIVIQNEARDAQVCATWPNDEACK